MADGNESTTLGEVLTLAYCRAMYALQEDETLVTATESAGLINDKQIFVKVARFSPDLLAEQPESGGLLENAWTLDFPAEVLESREAAQ